MIEYDVRKARESKEAVDAMRAKKNIALSSDDIIEKPTGLTNGDYHIKGRNKPIVKYENLTTDREKVLYLENYVDNLEKDKRALIDGNSYLINKLVECLEDRKDQESASDPVNHPQHYRTSSGLETIDVIEAFTEDLQGVEAVCTANVIKYICRWKKKNGLQDLEKARWYLDKLIGTFEKEETSESLKCYEVAKEFEEGLIKGLDVDLK